MFMQQCIHIQLQPDCVTCKCSNVLIQSLCNGRFYIPEGLYLYTACLVVVCVYCMADDASEKLVVWQVPFRILGLLHIWWDLVYSADDGDGATRQAAAWHESKMHILSNTTGNVAIENFKKILIDDFCIPRDTTARHYYHHSCYWNMGEFFTNHWSERNQDDSLFEGLFVIGCIVL